MTPSPASLVGRDAECARIGEALAADRPVLVTGEPGIGKTTLVRRAVEATGRASVTGAGFATLATMPYLPLRLALGTTVAGTPEQVAGRVEAAVGDGVLFLDDCQWMDHDTAAVVPLLVGRISLVLAARDPLEPSVLGLPAGTLEIRLGPLDREAASLVALTTSPGLAHRALGELLARAGGNPLLLQELARDGRPSPTLARAIAARVAAATPAAREALRLLVIADRPIPLPIDPEVRRELQAAGLATAGGGVLAIRHALIADAILATMSTVDRAAAHARVADLVADDATAAAHLAAAGQDDAAVARAMAALERTTDRRERAALLRIAAEASSGPDAARLRLEAARAALDVEEHLAAVELLAVEPDDPSIQGLREALLARAYGYLGRTAERDAAIERAVSLDPDPSGETAHIVGVERAAALANAGALAAAIAVLDAVDASAAGGHPSWRISRGSIRATIRFMAGDPPDVDALRSALDAALDAGESAATGRAANLLAVELGALGPGAALATADGVIPQLEAAGLETSRVRAERIQLLLFLGRTAEAVVAADELLERPYPFHSRAWSLAQRAEALCQLGRLADADVTLAEAVPTLTAEWMDAGEVATARAHVAFWSGRPREALEASARALAIPTNYAGNYHLAALVRAWAQADLGRAPDPLPAAPNSWLATAATAELAALEARWNGRPAVADFDRAASLWDGHHAFRAAVCRWAAGEAARHEGAADAPDRLSAALATADHHGFEPLAARVRRSLRLAGMRVTRRPVPDTGRGLLTPREREVLDLVAAGQSNVEIGRRMGLGRGTVIRMMSSAMAKLGAESRAHAVTLLSGRR